MTPRLRPAFALLLAITCRPALAQPRPSLDVRVDRVEKELRAVQRKVFPGATPAFVEPEIAAPPPSASLAGTPAGAPLTELTARVDALERTVAQLTGQVEQAEHRLTLLSEQAAKDRGEFDTRLKQIEAASAPLQPASATVAPLPTEDEPLSRAPAPSRSPRALPTAKTPPKTDDTASEPATGDATENAYLAAYRLWADKRYPEAEAALKAFITKNPKHRRTSYAQNLLGRSYLDDNHPATAAEAFAANYQTNPRGERAPESLFYLGQSLMKLNKPTDACRVYDELNTAYADKVPDSLRARVTTARKDAKCK